MSPKFLLAASALFAAPIALAAPPTDTCRVAANTKGPPRSCSVPAESSSSMSSSDRSNHDLVAPRQRVETTAEQASSPTEQPAEKPDPTQQTPDRS